MQAAQTIQKFSQKEKEKKPVHSFSKNNWPTTHLRSTP